MARSAAKELVSASAYCIEKLFLEKPFLLDYFQREYVWEEPQVEQLIADLSRKFLAQWSKEHSPQDVSEYDPYFLGPLIFCEVDGKTYLADGQQRIITLMLLLIFLRQLAMETPVANGKASSLTTLVMSERFGRRTFSVDVDEYADCFDALVNGRDFNSEDAPLKVRRVYKAYQCIGTHYPDELAGEVLSLFIDWLLWRVSVVAMHAGDRERAEEMFQSMNDRGVRLSPMDHLKRYLLSDADSEPRQLEGQWTAMVAALEKSDRGAAFAYLRTIFRAKFPEAARAPGPSLADATHEWVRAHDEEIWPRRKNGDRSRMFAGALYPLHSLYGTLLRARSKIDPSLQAVRFNAFNGISEQFDLTFAAVQPYDSEEVRLRKAALVANFLDLFYVTQTLDDEPVDQKAIDKLVSEVMPGLRVSESEENLRQTLSEHAADWPDRLERIPDLRYDSRKKFVLYVLARLTAWVEIGAGRENPTDRFLNRSLDGRNFEIEHLFSRTASKYRDMVPTSGYYDHLRNRIGALVLLDGLDNASYGGMLLEEKLKHYRKDTLLAGMLNADFFSRGNMRLRQFLDLHGLRSLVVPYDHSAALEGFIEARGRFYYEISKRIWSLEAIGLNSPTVSSSTSAKRRTYYGIRLRDLVDAGYIPADSYLVGFRKGRPYRARVLADGRILTRSGSAFAAPSKAVLDALGVAANGWDFWHLEQTNERLDTIRQRYLTRSSR